MDKTDKNGLKRAETDGNRQKRPEMDRNKKTLETLYAASAAMKVPGVLVIRLQEVKQIR